MNNSLIKQFQQSVNHLLPQGLAFSRDPDSNVQKIIKGIVFSLVEFKEFADKTMLEFLPHKTCSRLEDWEQTLGLPDACFGKIEGDHRRALVLAKLSGYVSFLKHEDSSPGSIGFMTKLCKFVGFNVSIKLIAPCHLEFTHTASALENCGLFRAGVHRVGRRLEQCDPSGLACFLEAIVPARFQITVIEA